MKKILVILLILAVVAGALFVGCRRERTPEPAVVDVVDYVIDYEAVDYEADYEVDYDAAADYETQE